VKIVLKASEDILGHAETSEARTDPPMGCGQAAFYPTEFYSRAEELFRRKTLALPPLDSHDDSTIDAVETELSKLHLKLTTERGEPISVVGFTVLDYRQELPDEPLTLEFYGIHHEQFSRLFPGHYEAYEASFKRA